MWSVKMKILSAYYCHPLWVAFFLLVSSAHSQAYSETTEAPCSDRRYVFSWNIAQSCDNTPRGGTTTGAPVNLVTSPTTDWQQLQQPGISKFEQDRRAILAMAGGYKTSFEFLETIGYSPDYTLARPYQSWGTEYVYLVEDQQDFISLQHIMVMVFQLEDGSWSDPLVMKHWRQDWHYQNRKLLEFVGDDLWQSRKLSKRDVKGTWSQSVYQVDDSPRYASYGVWTHNPSFSSWESQSTWRPLPRREHSVRTDYEVLEGINRHIILPTGWVQEEFNQKRTGNGYIANELGNNRYQRIKDFDWTAGDQYWQATAEFWAKVRSYWQHLSTAEYQVKMHQPEGKPPLFAVLFELADAYGKNEVTDPEDRIKEAMKPYVELIR